MQVYLKNTDEVLTIPVSVEQLRQGFDVLEENEVVVTEIECGCVNQNFDSEEPVEIYVLHYLALLLEILSSEELELLEAILDSDAVEIHTIADFINVIFNLNCYKPHEDIHSEEEWARQWLIEQGDMEGHFMDEEMLLWLDNYLDLSKVWRNEFGEGSFTESGYLEKVKENRVLYIGKEK